MDHVTPVPAGLRSFADVLRHRAADTPDRVTFTFLGERDGEVDRASDGEMDRRARAIGALLQQHGAAGERALILCPPGLDYIAAFYGALYAGAVAVPVYPPGPATLGRSLGRLEAIVADAEPRFVLCPSAMLAAREAIVAQAPRLAVPRWIAADDLSAGAEHGWRQPTPDADALAFLQYTSGSTGTPKGVMVTHGNLLHNTEQMRRLLGGGPGDRHVSWLPPYHDMGLVAGILMVSQFGMTVTLMSPVAFVKHPFRWIRTLSDLRATISGGAPFGFDLAARTVTDAELEGIDLQSVRVTCIAAEPVRPGTLDRFVARFGPVGFRRSAFLPCYGLAESTLMSTGGTDSAMPITRRFCRRAFEAGRLEDAAPTAPGVELVANGPVIDGLELLVVDPDTCRLRPPRQLGEIWLRGASVARGYWGREATTAGTFGATLAEPGEAAAHPGAFLRTGDLGAVVDGELYVGGRIKDLLIVRGRNLHAEDVEATVEHAHPALRPGGGAALSVETGDDELVAIVHEVEGRGVDRAAVAAAVREAVTRVHGFDLDLVALIRPRTLPRTTSGKVQRHECRRLLAAGQLRSAVHVWRGRRAAAAMAAEPAIPTAATPASGAIIPAPATFATEVAS